MCCSWSSMKGVIGVLRQARTSRVLSLALLVYLLGYMTIPAVSQATPPVSGGTHIIHAEPDVPGEAAIIAIMSSGTGSQTKDEVHCAHIAEHMVFVNRSANRRSLAEQVADWGGLVGGYTAGDCTAFEVTVPEQHVIEAVEQLCAALFDTGYDPEVYEREINGYLRVELKQMTSGYPAAFNHAFRQQMLQGTPYAEELFSTDITTVPSTRVAEWQRREYGRDRLVLVIVSTASWADIQAAAERSLEQAPLAVPASQHSGVRINPPGEAKFAIAGADDSIFILGLGVESISDSDRDDLALLFRLIQSKLRYVPIRELRGREDLFLVDFQRDSGYLQTGFKLSDYIAQGRDPLGELSKMFADTIQRFMTEGPGIGDLQLMLNTLSRSESSGSQAKSLQQAWELAHPFVPGSAEVDWAAYQQEDMQALQQRLKAVAAKYLPRARAMQLDIQTAVTGGIEGIIYFLVVVIFALGSVLLLARVAERRSWSFRVFLSLLSVVLKSTFRPGRLTGSEETRENSRLLQFFLGIILIFFALQLSGLLVRVCLMVGQPELVFILSATAVGSLLVFSGGYMLLSVFMWSKDKEMLQALPLSPGQVVLVRLVVVAIGQYPLVALFLLPPLLKYAAYMGGGPALWLTALFVMILIPVLSLTLVSLPLIFCMRYITSRVRERLAILGSLLLSASMILIRVQSSISSSRLPDVESLIMEQLKLRQTDIAAVMGRFFPPIVWTARALTSAGTLAGILYLVLLVGTCAFSLWILYHISQRYFLCVDISYARSVRANRRKHKQVTEQISSPFTSLLRREWKLFWRTPAFLSVTLPSILAPLLTMTPFLHGTIREQGVWVLAQVMRNYPSGTLLAPLIAVLAAKTVVTYSHVASTSISREGTRFYFSKMMPVPYDVQVKAKLAHAVLIGAFCLVPVHLLYAFLVRPGVVELASVLLASTLGLSYASVMCILCDLAEPKLDWDNAHTLMRKRSALVPSLMVLSAFVVTLLAGAGLLEVGLSSPAVYGLIAICFSALTWLAYRNLLRRAMTALDELDA